MTDKKKIGNEDTKRKGKEISTDDLEEVSGGSLRDVQFTETVDISPDTQNKI